MRPVPRLVFVIVGLVASAAATALVLERASNTPPLEVVDLSDRSSGNPALCPWREPEADLRRFFPGVTAATHHEETVILSTLRPRILKRLGPGAAPLQSNTLRVYRIERGGVPLGTIMIDRVAGEHGAIEVVVALGPDRRVRGLHLQRQREPAPIAAALTDTRWQAALKGKGPDDTWEVGKDLPEVPPAARSSAVALARAVRTLLVSFDIAETSRIPKRGTEPPTPHH